MGTVTYRFPHQILGIVNERYESGLLLQDTTCATTSPLFLPYSESYATTDLFAVVPIKAGVTLQAGVKNLLDRGYYYTAVILRKDETGSSICVITFRPVLARRSRWPLVFFTIRILMVKRIFP